MILNFFRFLYSNTKTVFETINQSEDLRKRIPITFGILILIRLGMFIPLPMGEINLDGDQSGLFNLFNLLSGGGFSKISLFSLNIIPYLNASMFIQFLTKVIPSLDNLRKEGGRSNRKKLRRITRITTIFWAIVQGFFLTWFKIKPNLLNWNFFLGIKIVFILTVGSMLVVWLTDKITDQGIGNGSTLLIAINTLPKIQLSNGFFSLYDFLTYFSFQEIFVLFFGVILKISSSFLLLLITVLNVICLQEATRQIPVIVGKQAREKMLRKPESQPDNSLSTLKFNVNENFEKTYYLYLAVLPTGIMPLIVASTILTLPSFFNITLSPGFYDVFYIFLTTTLNYLFAPTLGVTPEEIAKTLNKLVINIDGIRPGKATSQYIEEVLNRLSLIGGFCLGVVAVLPSIIARFFKIYTFRGLEAISLLLITAVVIETSKKIEVYLIKKYYEDIEKGNKKL
uniref:Preprotein translocase SecY subunit n=1 Tax=Glaucocystis sp. BBH TaxID=2023628 RepID=A0A3G1IUV4_9EUKA|nr:preprotein translocase SecY subunit [Glaucocystis sp. BBH]